LLEKLRDEKDETKPLHSKLPQMKSTKKAATFYPVEDDTGSIHKLEHNDYGMNVVGLKRKNPLESSTSPRKTSRRRLGQHDSFYFPSISQSTLQLHSDN
jgi:hypothetical protein